MKIDTSLPRHLAIKFAIRTGINWEDLYSEALEAYVVACNDGRYDPAKASFKTYAWICINSRLLDVCAKYQRAPEFVELDLQMLDPHPSPEDIFYFWELIRALPGDSIFVIRMVLSKHMDGVPPWRVKKRVRDHLRSQNWSHQRINRSFALIQAMLGGMYA